MEIENNILVDDLLQRMERCTKAALAFRNFSIDQLRFKTDEKWSALECLEHLNLYGDFYLVEIEKQILKCPRKAVQMKFKSGLLGNYFANLMKVKNGKVTKMKSPRDKNPSNSKLSITSLNRFLKQQEQIVCLLNQCRNIDLTKTKASISLTNFIKLRLGDTLRFYCYHIERHVLQAEKALERENEINRNINLKHPQYG